MSQSFAALGLQPELVRAVSDHGYETPTPVQAQAIPVILQGRDVLAGAQTGTGKTAGFTLPMLQRLAADAGDGNKTARHRVRALVLTPTRELAAQIEQSVRTYGKYLPLRSTLVYGGVGMQPQVDALARGVDILVATPGRLLDHVQQKTVDLGRVEILVLDEADRMLDMGFIRDIRRVLALLPTRRQNLLFSATFSDEIRKLAEDLLDNPALIEVARRNQESELVAQRIHLVDQARKRDLLAHLVSSGNWEQVLVFTRTKHGANRLAQQLTKQNIQADAIHGNKSQPQRTRALAGFKAGSVRVLVATDIAARGLDIEELPHVVNFDLPNVSEDYVHRIGRTGRAGSTGEAISLVSSEEMPLLADIEKLLKRRLERQVVPGFEPGTAPSEPDEPRNGRPGSDTSRARDARGRRPANAKSNTGIRGNVGHSTSRLARPATVQDPRPRDDDRQPSSNASSQFPSSGKVFRDPRPANAKPFRNDDRRRDGNASNATAPRKSDAREDRPVAALLGGSTRRTD